MSSFCHAGEQGGELHSPNPQHLGAGITGHRRPTEEICVQEVCQQIQDLSHAQLLLPPREEDVPPRAKHCRRSMEGTRANLLQGSERIPAAYLPEYFCLIGHGEPTSIVLPSVDHNTICTPPPPQPMTWDPTSLNVSGLASRGSQSGFGLPVKEVLFAATAASGTLYVVHQV